MGQTQTLLAGVATVALSVGNAPAAGPGFAIPGISQYDITWDVVNTGTAPATEQIDLEGALDSDFTNPIQLDTINIVGTVTGRHVTNKAVPFIRLNLKVVTGGDATTKLSGRIYLRQRGAGI